ncbi:ROK family protein [Actinomyces sp. 2119]|uniref:ROK family protein n=1 Tax=Actinomyces lilanjuaniae TaxID=2321394 RepID=A0ABM6Z2Z3_9ACTO|nr:MULTISPECIES: ROK family protein [Actinomyces]AYD89711.1 ROK family protein [Actinomyces lilanjuaniae]RJF44673.1 ROK family protein [Actinomyces sp. 2119]
MSTDIAIGVDVGGSGIKAAPVDLGTGEFTAERLRVATPQPATPDAVADVVSRLVTSFDLPAEVPVGVAVPAPVKRGVVAFMANLDPSWAGTDARALMAQVLGRQATVVNDADAAGYAEALYGAAREVQGLAIVTTLGTGIGSALVMNGVLVPGTELGHLEIDGYDAEKRASSAVRERKDMSWRKWARRLQRYYSHLEMLFSPDVFVVGGGVSRKHEKFLPLLDLTTPIVPASLLNRAGIVGAAALAASTRSSV